LTLLLIGARESDQKPADQSNVHPEDADDGPYSLLSSMMLPDCTWISGGGTLIGRMRGFVVVIQMDSVAASGLIYQAWFPLVTVVTAWFIMVVGLASPRIESTKAQTVQ
jgi:hypothetical protein